MWYHQRSIGQISVDSGNFLKAVISLPLIKETKSVTMNIFRFFYFLLKSFVKVELSYVFTINLFTIGKVNYLIKIGVLVIICVPPIIIDS